MGCLFSGLLLAFSMTAANAQIAFPITGLCNGTFADANATGAFSYNPHVPQGSQPNQTENDTGETLSIEVAVTLTQARNTSLLELSAWFDTNGADYSNDFSLGYDVCGMNIDILPENTMLRGQSDNGSCYQMFDQTCVSAIESAAAKFAYQLVGNPTPGPDSNLTWTSLPTVCYDIANMLTPAIPQLQECAPYVNNSLQVNTPYALTGYNSSRLYEQGCTLNDTFNMISYGGFPYSSANYALAAQTVFPLLAIWMPIANAARKSYISQATAGMICGRVNHFNPGSTIPAALAAPTAVNTGKGGLSGGAIAGIVVGVVLGVALIAGAIVWWFMNRRKKSTYPPQPRYAAVETASMPRREDADIFPEEAPENAVSEMPAKERQPEMDSGTDHEVYELAVPVMELEGDLRTNHGRNYG